MSTTEVTFYNNEQKERYFAERELSYRKIRLIMRTFFNITAETERNLEKDCCNFTTKEILDMYVSCFTTSWEFLLNFNSQLKIYTAWCLKEGLVNDSQNHYEEIDKNDMYNCLNLGLKQEMILTRKEIEREIAHFPNVSDQFLALAINEGLCGPAYSDFYNLDITKFKGNTVELNGRTLEVTPLLVAKAMESGDEYVKYNEDGPIRTGYRLTDTSIIKDSHNALTDSLDRNTRKIQRRLVLMEKRYGKAFSFVGLKNSGRIEMIKKFMAEDKSDDIRETYERHKDVIEFRYGKLQRVYRWIEEYKTFFDTSQ